MKFSAIKEHPFYRPAVGALLAILCGLVLWATPLGDGWTNASDDCLFRFCTFSETNQVVLVQMDSYSDTALGQTRDQPWDRTVHAKLFNKLADDKCALAVADVRFETSQGARADQALAAALRRLPRVVLAAREEEVAHDGLYSEQVVSPLDIFLEAAHANWGLAEFDKGDTIVRHHWPFPDPGAFVSLPERAAALMGAPVSETPSEKWIRYYDSTRAWTRLSYVEALQQNPGYFGGKIVFIGSKPKSLAADDPEEDKFQVPQTRWTGEAVGGVEINLTCFLNLVDHDWLRRMSGPAECLVFIFSGIILGLALSLFHRGGVLLVAGAAGLAAALAGICLGDLTNYWFPWVIVAGGQLPCALAWILIVPRRPVAKRAGTPPQPAGKTIALSFPAADTPDTPDFELFQPPIGEGSFGKVWIVRNAIGQWQALKAIYQSKFGGNTRPYEAEFSGLQRYKPVSEKHAGLLRIEMISKMKPEGYFYYVMELGDAQNPGWETNPASYKPLDLDNLRRQAGGRLPAAECLNITAILADALDFLHQQNLIHRDIKPSNVVFVNGRPKLADIGLVADIRPTGHMNTMVGTPGYMPPSPERPGTVQADIYALGMMLYVISTGKDPDFFPEISTTLMGRSGHEEFLRLDAIILKACQPDRSQRYSSTALMLKDLQEAMKLNENGGRTRN